MKNLRVIIFLIPFLFLACVNKEAKNENCITYDSGFSFCQDTIFVNIKGVMTHALKYQDKYYVLFQQNKSKYEFHGKRLLYILSNGEIEKTVSFPKDFGAGYLDFFVKNDSIILKPYMKEQVYFLDIQNFVWKEIDKADDLIFEDEKFYVYSLDFGEWGGKTWFKDKKTGVEYLIESTTPLVNKIDTTYFLTDAYKIVKIENPLKLNRCVDNDVTYENIKNSQKFYSWYGEPIGFDVIYADLDTMNFDDRTFVYPNEINIVSSFVMQNELLHIQATDSANSIVKIENSTIIPMQKIEKELFFYNWHYSYRCRNLNENNELLKFRTKDEQIFGLVDIIDNKIYAHYFVNKAELSPKLLGATTADSIFVKRLDFILSDFDNLHLKDVSQMEQELGTFEDVIFDNNNNTYTKHTYLIKEDSLISNSIEYNIIRADDLVNRISYDWDKADYSRYDLDKLTRETFIAKLKFLETKLIEKLGEPTEIRKEKDKYPSIIWKTQNGLTVDLMNGINSKTNYNKILLTISKN
ncbi:MAG: hypothetical protein LBQ22_05815 [Bacteroidales bacterium]|jgi:hypothetical protein|nr:hypothetical protein [Bacteroidales bacterium]